MYITSQTD